MSYVGPVQALGEVDGINTIFDTPSPYRSLSLTVSPSGVARQAEHEDGWIERLDIRPTAFELREAPLPGAGLIPGDVGDVVFVEYREV